MLVSMLDARDWSFPCFLLTESCSIFMKFLFLIKSNVKNCRITSCQHPLLDSARIKSSFFVWKTERKNTNLHQRTSNTRSAKSHFTPAKSLFCERRNVECNQSNGEDSSERQFQQVWQSAVRGLWAG